MFLTEFFAVTVLAILGPMSPGPDFLMVTRNTLKYSKRVGIYTALGITLGLIVHIVYSVVGIGFLTNVLNPKVTLFFVERAMGVALIALGLKVATSTSR